MIDLEPRARSLVVRLRNLDLARPRIDRDAAGAALLRHLDALGQPERAVRWCATMADALAEACDGRPDREWDAAWEASWARANLLRVWRGGGFRNRRQRHAAHYPYGVPWLAGRRPASQAVRAPAWAVALGAANPGRPAVALAPESAVESALDAVGWAAVAATATGEALERIEHAARADLPILDAFEAGLCAFWVFPERIVALEAPALRTEEGRLHASDGPAVAWRPEGRDGERCWFWRGVRVTRELIEAPEEIDVRAALEGPNLEVRRATCERLGWDRVLGVIGAREVQRDDFGVLLEAPGVGDGHRRSRFVRVVCPSTGNRYILRVPPSVTSAHKAVAWTFGVEKEAYRPSAEA